MFVAAHGRTGPLTAGSTSRGLEPTSNFGLCVASFMFKAMIWSGFPLAAGRCAVHGLSVGLETTAAKI